MSTSPEKISRHIRQNVVGYVALFIALSGTAYAVDGPLPGQDQVGSADIINNEVQSADIKDANLTTVDIRSGAVTTGKLLDDDIRGADVRNEDLTGADIADTGSLGTAEIDESTLFNDNSLDANDVADSSSLGTVEIDEGSLNVVEGSSTSQILFGREQLSGAEAGPSAVIFAGGVANVNAEKNANDDCTLTFLNPPTNASTYTFTRQVFPSGGAATFTDGTLASNTSNSAGPFASAVHVRWQAWVAGDPSGSARVITIDAAARPSGTTCDFSAVMTIRA